MLPRVSRSLTRNSGLQAWGSVWAKAEPQAAAAPCSPCSPCWVDGPSPQAGSSMNPTPLKVACPRGPLWRQGWASLLSGQGRPVHNPKAPEGAAPCVLGGVGVLKWGRTWGGQECVSSHRPPQGLKAQAVWCVPHLGGAQLSPAPTPPGRVVAHLPCRIRASAMRACGGSNGSWELGNAYP